MGVHLWPFYVGAIIFVVLLFVALVKVTEPQKRRRYALQLLLTWALLAIFQIWKSRH